ncbi:MAG: DUF3313 family protein [Pseudomonadota bacterium]
MSDSHNQAVAQSAPNGMVSLDSRDFDQAWIRSDLDVSGFTAVIIEPAEIEFDPAWARSDQRTGSRLPKDLADIDGTREEMLKVIDQGIRQALKNDGRFRVVETAGPGVLRLRPRVDDLHISAIDPMKMVARSDQYVHSVGHGRAGIEVIDSVSGEVLMQMSDPRETRRYPNLQLANPGLVAADFIEWYQRFSEDVLNQMSPS